MKANWTGYINTMMSYHLHIDPDTLDDHTWAEKFNQLVDIRKKEKEAGGAN